MELQQVGRDETKLTKQELADMGKRLLTSFDLASFSNDIRKGLSAALQDRD